MFFDTDPIRVFPIVVSEGPSGEFIACDKFTVIGVAPDLDEILKAIEVSVQAYKAESGEYAMARVFLKGEGVPFKVFL